MFRKQPGELGVYKLWQYKKALYLKAKVTALLGIATILMEALLRPAKGND